MRASATVRAKITICAYVYDVDTGKLTTFLPGCLLERSVLTEKIARRGPRLSRVYAVDVLEVLLVHEVMDASPVITAADEPLTVLRTRADLRLQWFYPVIDEQSALLGVIPAEIW